MRLIYILVMLLLSNFVLSQKEMSYWYFGARTGMDFSSGTPKVNFDNASITPYYGGSSISDANGNLLYYADGSYAFDNLHQEIGSPTWLQGGGRQSSVIVPYPGQSKYFIFVTSPVTAGFTSNGPIPPHDPYGFLYYILDQGIIEFVDNNKLLLNTTNKVSATHHNNGTDFWVVTHLENRFYAYKITDQGLNLNPVISTIGKNISQNIYLASNGYLKISPDGKKLAISHTTDLQVNEIPTNLPLYTQHIYPWYSGGYLAVYDFDNVTGIISNEKIVSDIDFVVPGGIEFSHDSKYLYATIDTYESVMVSESGKLVQYDLESSNVSDSERIIYDDFHSETYELHVRGALQLGLDGKIYYASNPFEYLSVIHNPYKDASEIEFEFSSFSLNGECNTGRYHNWALPNTISSFFKKDIYFTKPSCREREIKFYYAIGADEIFWDFGDGQTSSEISPTHTYSEVGEYSITANVWLNGAETTYQKIININPNPFADGLFLDACDNDLDGIEAFNLLDVNSQIDGNNNLSFYETIYDAENKCNAIENLDNYLVETPTKTIYVKIENQFGCSIISELELIVKVGLSINLNDKYICSNNGEIIIEIPENYTSYSWDGLTVFDLNQETNTNVIRITKEGDYIITITNENDCEYTDSFSIHYYPDPIVSQMNFQDNYVEILAEGNTPFLFSLNGVLWQQSNFLNNLPLNIYSLYIKDKYGCTYKMDDFSLFTIPNIITPNNDGFNDKWEVRGLSVYENIKIKIFDRYGKTIVDKIISNQDLLWDGYYLGRPAPTGSYWYILEVSPDRRFKGHISVLNN